MTVSGVDGGLDPLRSAVIEGEALAARKVPAGAPCLFALVAVRDVRPDVGEDHPAARAGLLVLVEQDGTPFRQSELGAVLASVSWPDAVCGCVLVTDFVVLPDGACYTSRDRTRALAVAPGAAGGGMSARLAVGVLRDGRSAHYLRLRWSGVLFEWRGVADDLVAALRSTFS